MVSQLELHRKELTDPFARDAAQRFIDSIKGIIRSMHTDRAKLNQPTIAPGIQAFAYHRFPLLKTH